MPAKAKSPPSKGTAKKKVKEDKQTSMSGVTGGGKNKKVVLPPLKKPVVREDPAKKTYELHSQLSSLETKLTMEKQEALVELSKLNEQLEDMNKRTKDLSKENQSLFKKLKDIKDEVDDRMKVQKIFQVKQEEIENEEKVLEKDIQIKEKEIKISTRNQEIYKKDLENYKKILDSKTKTDVIGDMKNTIDSLNNKKDVLEKEINSLKKVTVSHKKCNKILEQLEKQLVSKKSEYEYGLKSQATEGDKSGAKSAKKRASEPDKKPKAITSTNKSVALEKSKISRLKESLAPLWEEFELVNEKYRNDARSATRIKDEETENTGLFLPEEKSVLQKFVPENKLEEFQKRYADIESKNQELKAKIKQEKAIITKEINDSKSRIDYSTLEVKEKNMRAIQLNCEYSKGSRMISDLYSKMKKLKKEYQFNNDIYKYKLKENVKLSSHLEQIEEKIKNGELVLKPIKKEEESEENEGEQEEEENEEQEPSEEEQ